MDSSFAPLPFRNDGSFFELFQKLQQVAGPVLQQTTDACQLKESEQHEQHQGHQPTLELAVSSPCEHSQQHRLIGLDTPSTAAVDYSSASNTTDPRLPKAQPVFIHSETFTGPKTGYVFRSGDQGLGYYADARTQSLENNMSTPSSCKLSETLAEPAKPTVPVIKAIKPKMAVAVQSKKRKAEDNKSAYLREMERYRSYAVQGSASERPLVK